MKMTEIRSLGDGDLQVQLDKKRRELFDLKVKSVTETLDNPRLILSLRKDVARILTERRRRQDQGEAAS